MNLKRQEYAKRRKKKNKQHKNKDKTFSGTGINQT